jgi:hypothetical protein
LPRNVRNARATQRLPGSAGTPSLDLAGGALPWLGDTVTLELTSAPPTTAALLLVGTSRTAWGPVPLPFDLSAIGMTGCMLHVSGSAIVGVAVNGGRGAVPLAIPNEARSAARAARRPGVGVDVDQRTPDISHARAGSCGKGCLRSGPSAGRWSSTRAA